MPLNSNLSLGHRDGFECRDRQSYKSVTDKTDQNSFLGQLNMILYEIASWHNISIGITVGVSNYSKCYGVHKYLSLSF